MIYREKFLNLDLIRSIFTKENLFNLFLILILTTCSYNSYKLATCMKELSEIKEILEELKAQKWSNFFTYKNLSRWGVTGFLFLFLIIAVKFLIGTAFLMLSQLILLKIPFFKDLIHN